MAASEIRVLEAGKREHDLGREPNMSTPDAPQQDWGLARRIAFRFAFLYFVLYNFPSPVDQLPGMSWLSEAYGKPWEAFVPWVGKHLLHLPQDITVLPNGSGDTTFNYVQVLCFLVLAVVGTGLWSLVDARRTRYPKAQEALRVYLRYVLGVAMLSYGISKVIKMQFPFPSPERLLQPYGESSPMGLLWTFMGYSTGYTVFGGLAEMLGGLLLFFRRTLTLGALVVAAVMTNVVMLNFCYDVPVKLYSSHLLLMAVFLLLPDLRRLAHVLVLNRATEPVVLRTPFQARWMERSRPVVKFLFIGVVLVTLTRSVLEGYHQYGDDAPTPPLYGLYEVETFTRNGQAAQPLTTDDKQWRALIVNRYGGLAVKLMNGSTSRFRMKNDAEKKTLELATFGPGVQDSGDKLVLIYSQPDPEHLVLEGPVQNEALSIRLRKVDESKYLLVNRGFHWINESPFNR